MRLTHQERTAITEAERSVFGEDAEIRLFGSRAQDARRGGYIDKEIAMAATRRARPLGSGEGDPVIDPGTLARTQSSPPGPVGHYSTGLLLQGVDAHPPGKPSSATPPLAELPSETTGVKASLADAEMAIALKRAELNRALAHKTSYNTEGHNLCLALVHYNDGTSDVLAAYSNDSAVPESMRLGLGLIPNLYGELAEGKHFGCGGMAQFHTEPKLLNWLCATSIIRRGKYHQEHLPRIPFYRAILNKQRTEAAHHASRLKRPENMAAVTLVTEIDCCTTCTKYAIDRFRARFPHVALHVIELGKQSGEQTEYTRVSKTTKSPPS